MKLFLEKLLDILEALLRFRRRAGRVSGRPGVLRRELTAQRNDLRAADFAFLFHAFSAGFGNHSECSQSFETHCAAIEQLFAHHGHQGVIGYRDN
mgnify:CR=1 FL=1